MSIIGKVESSWRYPRKACEARNWRKRLQVTPESTATRFRLQKLGKPERVPYFTAARARRLLHIDPVSLSLNSCAPVNLTEADKMGAVLCPPTFRGNGRLFETFRMEKRSRTIIRF